MLLKIPKKIIEESLSNFRNSHRKEKVILWLGRKVHPYYVVEELYIPIQITDVDYFKIPEVGMISLMGHLRQSRKMIVAQIHTHPFDAYHSEADSNWAIIRHIGAYSLVLPFFSITTDLDNFLDNVVTFVLNESNEWIDVSNSNLEIYE